jgi:hypothetical protein
VADGVRVMVAIADLNVNAISDQQPVTVVGTVYVK